MKTLYGLTKILCNEKPKQSTAVLDKSGNLNKKEEVQARWTEHFKEVLNRGEPENPVLMMRYMNWNLVISLKRSQSVNQL